MRGCATSAAATDVAKAKAEANARDLDCILC